MVLLLALGCHNLYTERITTTEAIDKAATFDSVVSRNEREYSVLKIQFGWHVESNSMRFWLNDRAKFKFSLRLGTAETRPYIHLV